MKSSTSKPPVSLSKLLKIASMSRCHEKVLPSKFMFPIIARFVSSSKVEIPLANGNSASRVLAYDVEIDAGGAVPKIYRSVFAKGCNMGIGHEPDGGVTTLFVPRANLPRQGEITISVRPLSSLGTSGKAITKRIKLSGGC